MPTLKDLTIEVLKNLPPSASLEEIMYKVNLAAQVMEGLKDAEQRQSNFHRGVVKSYRFVGQVIWTEKAQERAVGAQCL
jgi:hypothetical protein